MGAKVITTAVFVVCCVCSTTARAWFFFFIPGAVTSKIGDALTGAQGENCVSEKAKVGDILRSPSGNTATIKSLSGESSRCKNPALPIRALLEFNYSFSSKAGINIPDRFQPKDLTDTQKFQGVLLFATDDANRAGVHVSARKRQGLPDPSAIARGVAAGVSNALIDARTSNEEQLVINGMPAWRFEVTGKTKGIFAQTYTYLVTILEGEQEFVVINAWVPTDQYKREKEGLAGIATKVTGIRAAAPSIATPPTTDGTPASTTPQSQALLAPAEVSGATSAALPASTTAPQGSGESHPLPGAGAAAANRLRELNKLYKEGILSEKDYETKKQAILSEL